MNKRQKNISCSLLAAMTAAILLFMTAAGALAEKEQVKYIAKTSVEFHLRSMPNGRKLVQVPKGVKIQVIEWAEDWCLARYNNVSGYCKTEWLYLLRSLDPYLYPLPQEQCSPTGYIVMNGDMWIQAGNFEGVVVSSGKKVCVSYTGDGSCKLPVWRDEQAIDDIDAMDYYPFVDWEIAKPGDIIGGFTSFYSKSQGKKHPEAREKNILLGCSRINSHLVAMGDTFSFNGSCGPYTKSNGYFLAPNVSQDGEGYGGGICQVTTTLYNAILTLPLRIEEWSIHKYAGVSYVPQFFDAAVGKYSDFVFTNTLPYPIYIQATAENGIINVFIVRAE